MVVVVQPPLTPGDPRTSQHFNLAYTERIVSRHDWSHPAPRTSQHFTLAYIARIVSWCN